MYTNQLIISFITIGALYFLMNMKPKKKGQKKNEQRQQLYNNPNYNQNYQGYPTINNQPVFNSPPSVTHTFDQNGIQQVQMPHNNTSDDNPFKINESFSSYTTVSPEIKKNDTNTAKAAFAFLTIGILYLLYDKYYSSEI